VELGLSSSPKNRTSDRLFYSGVLFSQLASRHYEAFMRCGNLFNNNGWFNLQD
jgi:hypothetical protein